MMMSVSVFVGELSWCNCSDRYLVVECVLMLGGLKFCSMCSVVCSLLSLILSLVGRFVRILLSVFVR